MSYALYTTALNLTGAASCIAIGLVLEAWFRQLAPSSLRVNVPLNVLFYVVDAAFSVAAGSGLIWVIQRLPGYGVLPMSVITTWRLGQFLVLMVVGDICYYWMHRLQHRFAWLWAIHSVHHSDEDMHVTTARRHHWLEVPMVTMLVTLPTLYLFGPSAPFSLTFMVFSHAWAYLAHLDVPVSFGAVNWIVTTPQTHRLHHSSDRAHFDKNFAMLMPIWDVLFGTFLAPTTDRVQTGVHDLHLDSVSQASWHPMRRWAEMLRHR